MAALPISSNSGKNAASKALIQQGLCQTINSKRILNLIGGFLSDSRLAQLFRIRPNAFTRQRNLTLPTIAVIMLGGLCAGHSSRTRCVLRAPGRFHRSPALGSAAGGGGGLVRDSQRLAHPERPCRIPRGSAQRPPASQPRAAPNRGQSVEVLRPVHLLHAVQIRSIHRFASRSRRAFSNQSAVNIAL
jgi:hypothetical protein